MAARARRADRQVYLVLVGELLGDLLPAVTRAHDDDGASGNLTWIAVVGAVKLKDVRVEPIGEGGGNRGVLEGPGGDDYLPCSERALIGVRREPVTEVLEPSDGAVDLHGQLEAGGEEMR